MPVSPILKAIAENPFYVLGVSPECSRQEFEREGQKLLSMIALKLPGAGTYSTPLGNRIRTAELIRLSMAELRDPAKRLLHELLATLPPVPLEQDEEDRSLNNERWTEAPAAFGFGRYREQEE
jgi:hypothetical protein